MTGRPSEIFLRLRPPLTFHQLLGHQAPIADLGEKLGGNMVERLT